jgi:hypothetical protein
MTARLRTPVFALALLAPASAVGGWRAAPRPPAPADKPAPAGRVVTVSPDGDDANPGTADRPFRTVRHAATRAEAGDTVVLRGGTYPIAAPPPRFTAPDVTVRAADGENPVLVAPTDDRRVFTVLDIARGADRLTVRGVEIVGGYLYGVKTTRAVGLRLIGCKIHGTGRDGVKLDPGSADALIEDCEIFGTGKRATNAEGIDNVNAARMVVRRCHIHDIRTTGIYFKGGAAGCLVEDCRIEDCGGGGVYFGFWGTGDQWFDREANPDFYEAVDGTVRNNRIARTAHAGIGFFGAKNCAAYGNRLEDVARRAMGGILIAAAPRTVDGRVFPAPTVNPLIAGNVVAASGDRGRPALDLRDGAFAPGGTARVGRNHWHSPGRGVNLAAGHHRTLGEADSTAGEPLPKAAAPLPAPPDIPARAVGRQ